MPHSLIAILCWLFAGQYVPFSFTPASSNSFTPQNPLTNYTSNCGGTSGGTCATGSQPTVPIHVTRLVGFWILGNGCPTAGTTDVTSTNGDIWTNNGGTYDGATGYAVCVAGVANSLGGTNDIVTASVPTGAARGISYMDLTWMGTTPTLSFVSANTTNSSPWALVNPSISTNSAILQVCGVATTGSYTSVTGGYAGVAGSNPASRYSWFVYNTLVGTGNVTWPSTTAQNCAAVIAYQ
jgi:hypothetical protein